MTPFDDFAAVILTGGKGARMGGVNKSLIEIEGASIISKILQVLSPLFKEIIIAGKSIGTEIPDGVKNVTDRFADCGPLAGIDAAFSVTKAPYLFVFAGDMPWLSSNLIINQVKFIMDNPCEIVVPRLGDDIEPLHAILSSNISFRLHEFLKTKEKHAVRYFYSKADLRYFDLSPSQFSTNPFKSINFPDDLLA
jgi:molybdenum cofactor guanylyltransferase